jgi:hypothetical protein
VLLSLRKRATCQRCTQEWIAQMKVIVGHLEVWCLPSTLFYIIGLWMKEFAWIFHSGTIQVQAWLHRIFLYNSSNLIDVFRYKLHSFFEFTICWILFQMAPSLRLVVQCGIHTVLPFRLYKERVVWLIAGYCNPVSRRGNVVRFCDFPTKIGTG